MDWDELESGLTGVAERLGIEIRHVRYEGEGGLCKIRGRRVLIINDRLDTPERVAIIAQALAGLPELDEMYVVPEVRRVIDRYGSEE